MAAVIDTARRDTMMDDVIPTVGASMRIVVIGQAPFGEAVAKRLVEAGEDIVGISAPATPEDGRPDPLRAYAESQGLPVLTARALKKEDVYQEYASWKPDLNVMAFVTDILAERVLFTPTLHTIQYHPSLLPKHRGASAMNWAIMQGDAKTGLTIFWPDQGIDTGPILLQREVDITPDDTLGSLYFDRLFPMGVDAMVESVRLVKEGKAPKIVQDGSDATYEPICKPEHAAIDWSKPAGEVYNLIRGCTPQPGAHTTFRGAPLKISDCGLVNEGGGKPGSIARVTDAEIIVHLNGGALALRRVQPQDSPKLKAAEFIAATGIKAGDTLGM